MKAEGLRTGRIARVVVVIMAAFLLYICSPLAQAVTYGGGSAQSYTAEAAIPTSTIVQFSDKDKKIVRTAAAGSGTNVLGVVVDRSQLLVTPSDDSIEHQTFVADSGTYNTMVSTQGGAIQSGDYVALSSIDGVAMKASTDQKIVFGRAAASFDGKGVVLGKTQLKDKNGSGLDTVALGSIPVTIDIRNNPNEKSTKANVPDFLERVGQAIAEKEVSPVRIYISVAVAIISLLAALVVLYAGIRNGVISIGRNPMSKKSIFRALIEVILTSLLIVIIGLFAVYLLLKL